MNMNGDFLKDFQKNFKQKEFFSVRKPFILSFSRKIWQSNKNLLYYKYILFGLWASPRGGATQAKFAYIYIGEFFYKLISVLSENTIIRNI